MHKIEIIITAPDSEALRKILDTILQLSLSLLQYFGLTHTTIIYNGAILYNVSEEKEEENVG